MSEQTKKSGVAFWATVVVVMALVALVAAYPLLIGPVCWLADRDMLPEIANKPIDTFYSPLMWLMGSSETARTIFRWYIGLWVDGSEAAPRP
jgi:hypothetical protein